jgi:serine/threonine protein kinase/Tfp pilus assembly protein PilF
MSVPSGTHFGPYEVISRIGAGGMGEVYRAKDTRLGRFVAIKILPARFSEDRNRLMRFEQEACSASALNHPNIITIYDIGSSESGIYIAMELIEGKTLREILNSGRLPLKKAIHIGMQLADGLARAHEAGIIHRDLKPENFMITKDGFAKILDFGLAKISLSKQEEVSFLPTSPQTDAGIILGTAAYMSPEQAAGESVDFRSDQFSLGTILYEMVTGKNPFHRKTSVDTLSAITNEEPKPLNSMNSQVPLPFQMIVERCIAKNREDRYASTRDLAKDLHSVRDHFSGAVSSGESVRSVPHPTRRAGIGIGAIVLVIIALAVALNSDWLKARFFKTHFRPNTRQNSIAVLPFRNMSPDKNAEYFSDGMTEDIITQLTKINKLKVISSTSMMRYKNTNKSLRDIGMELNVSTILEGSVRKEGDQIRISSQLINAETDEHIWAQSYDRELKDVFKVQSDIARQIANELRIELTSPENQRLSFEPTKNLTAYDYYLKGREYYRRFHKKDNENAIKLFQKAIESDPNFAQAYAGLSLSYSKRVMFDFPETWLDSAFEAANKAISLDPNLPEACHALGNTYQARGLYRKALEIFRKGYDLNPNHAIICGKVGEAYGEMGKFDESLPWLKKQSELDPADFFPYFGLGWAYTTLGDDANAQTYLNKSVELAPDFSWPYFWLGMLDIFHGKCSEAMKKYQKVFTFDANDGIFLASHFELYCNNLESAKAFNEKFGPDGEIPLGYIFWKQGKKQEALALFSKNEKRILLKLDQGNESYGLRYEMARINAVQEKKKEALSWLQKAIDAGWLERRIASIDPLMENLRGEPNYQKMLAGVQQKIAKMRAKVESNP